MVQVETEAPALGRKPPETATLATLDKRASPRLYPRARLRIRLAAGFAGEELLDYCESEGRESSACLARKAVLKREAEPWLGPVRPQDEA